MLPTFISDAKRLAAAGRLAEEAAKLLEAQFCVRLWDGSVIPLGPDADPRYFLAIRSAGVLGSLLRRPTLENLLIQYATGGLDLQGGDLIELAELTHGDKAMRKRLKERFPKVSKLKLIRLVLPLLFARSGKRTPGLNYDKDETGRIQSQRSEKEFIQFHYDLGNDFYQLFLDPEMQYSCAYFTDWQNSLAEAQRDKIDMICRKLGLQPGDRFLDIGCGWGALICHAAKKYGVTAHGVTLSEEQAAWARDRIAKEGLADQVTVELKGYSKLEGKYDKIASIGMYEHVGIANYPGYFKKLRSLLRDRGILLNHGITRRAKKKKKFRKISPGRGVILKYIFPGSELDHIGHSVEVMEACGFEVHDVEGWREHYALTTRYWCQRLSARREEAIRLVGPEKYRLWVAYLAGVSFSFFDGSLRIFQTVATKHRCKGPSTMPPSREHLYASASEPTVHPKNSIQPMRKPMGAGSGSRFERSSSASSTNYDENHWTGCCLTAESGRWTDLACVGQILRE